MGHKNYTNSKSTQKYFITVSRCSFYLQDPIRLPCKTYARSTLLPFLVLYGVHALFMLFVFINVYLYATRFPYQMISVSFNRNTTGITSVVGTAYPSGAPESTPVFPWGSCYSKFNVLCIILSIIFCLFVWFLLAIVLCTLYITPFHYHLTSSNFSS